MSQIIGNQWFSSELCCWETGVYRSLLLAAWRRYNRNMVEPSTSSWRTYGGKATLILAICSMLLELVFYYSWFHNGGSPHGLMPSPGIWKFVGRDLFRASKYSA
jgi:hypothetical protein